MTRETILDLVSDMRESLLSVAYFQETSLSYEVREILYAEIDFMLDVILGILLEEIDKKKITVPEVVRPQLRRIK